MFEWKKIGRIFDPTTVKGRDWLHEFAQAPATLLFDDFIRVYFSCRSKKDAKNQFISYSSYLDLDINDLTNIIKLAEEPILKLGKRGCFDEFGTYPFSAIRNNGKILGYYAGWTRCDSVPFNTAIGYAISDDNGKTFRKIGDGPVLSYSIDEPFIISGPKIRCFNNRFYLFYIAGEKWVAVNNRWEMSTKIRVATSLDGINWEKAEKKLIQEKLGSSESQASPDVFYDKDKYHMFFDYWLPEKFRQTQERRIGYAYSDDLISWLRADDKVGIDVSEQGFDNEMIAYPHVFKIKDKTFMLYLGNEVGRFGFGLAELKGEL